MHDDMQEDMQEEFDGAEYTERERAMFAALPREGALDSLRERRLVNALRAEGYFARTPRRRWWPRLAAAAALLVIGGVAGGAIGARYGGRNSIEARLERTDLTLGQRVLLLQRTGSAYIRAANAYADAAVHIDSTAIEVASQVLMGAAQAVARRSLDGGMTTRLAAVLQSPGGIP